MKKRIDYTGQKIRNVTVLEYIGWDNQEKKTMWKCQKNDGSIVELSSHQLHQKLNPRPKKKEKMENTLCFNCITPLHDCPFMLTAKPQPYMHYYTKDIQSNYIHKERGGIKVDTYIVTSCEKYKRG